MADTLFPYNVVDIVAEAAQARDGEAVIVKRPVHEEDPSKTVGIFAQDWTPTDDEIGGMGPTISRYLYRLQVMIKAGNEEEGQRDHAILSKSLRSMLYLDSDLEVAYASLTETMDGLRESFSNRGVLTQRFFSSEMGRTFVYLSTIDLWVDTVTQ